MEKNIVKKYFQVLGTYIDIWNLVSQERQRFWEWPLFDCLLAGHFLQMPTNKSR